MEKKIIDMRFESPGKLAKALLLGNLCKSCHWFIKENTECVLYGNATDAYICWMKRI